MKFIFVIARALVDRVLAQSAFRRNILAAALMFSTTGNQIGLTFAGAAAPPVSASKSCASIFSGEEQSSRREAKLFRMRKDLIGDPIFEQNRTIKSLYDYFPGLKNLLPNLPAGALVVDLGAGHGATVGSAVHGSDFIGGVYFHEVVTAEIVHSLQNLEFLGITATTEPYILAPHVKSAVPHTLVDTSGRYTILEGRLLEDIPDAELKKYTEGKKVVAFSLIGAFEYTTTPDLAFEKVWNMFSVGDELHLQNGINKIIMPDGSVLSYGDYAAICGFKVAIVTAIVGYYEDLNYSWNPEKKISEKLKHPMYASHWKLEKTTAPYHRIPLAEEFEQISGRPPTFIFRAKP